MKGFAYTGEKAPFLVPVCMYEGWLDARKYKQKSNLYRYPIYKKLGWEIGFFFGSLACWFLAG